MLSTVILLLLQIIAYSVRFPDSICIETFSAVEECVAVYWRRGYPYAIIVMFLSVYHGINHWILRQPEARIPWMPESLFFFREELAVTARSSRKKNRTSGTQGKAAIVEKGELIINSRHCRAMVAHWTKFLVVRLKNHV